MMTGYHSDMYEWDYISIMEGRHISEPEKEKALLKRLLQNADPKDVGVFNDLILKKQIQREIKAL